MGFAWIKILHIISASVLFGTGLGTAFYMFYVNQQSNVKLIAKVTSLVVLADWCFTLSSGLIQAVTGLALIYLKGYSFMSFWIWASIMGYLIAGACWIPVVWLQIKCRNLALMAVNDNSALPNIYYSYFRTWWVLGIPAFIALLGVFYLMTNRPESFSSFY